MECSIKFKYIGFGTHFDQLEIGYSIIDLINITKKRVDVRTPDNVYCEHGWKKTNGPITHNLGFASLVKEMKEDNLLEPVEVIGLPEVIGFERVQGG